MELKKKGRNLRRRIFGSKKDSNSNWDSIETAPGAHSDPGPGNDAGNTEPTASGKFSYWAHLCVIDNGLTFLQAPMPPQIRVWVESKLGLSILPRVKVRIALS